MRNFAALLKLVSWLERRNGGWRAEQSNTDGGDKARAASQVGMIAYAGEATVLNDDLLCRLTLHISVLNAQQACRSEQPRCLRDHHSDRI